MYFRFHSITSRTFNFGHFVDVGEASASEIFKVEIIINWKLVIHVMPGICLYEIPDEFFINNYWRFWIIARICISRHRDYGCGQVNKEVGVTRKNIYVNIILSGISNLYIIDPPFKLKCGLVIRSCHNLAYINFDKFEVNQSIYINNTILDCPMVKYIINHNNKHFHYFDSSVVHAGVINFKNMQEATSLII